MRDLAQFNFAAWLDDFYNMEVYHQTEHKLKFSLLKIAYDKGIDYQSIHTSPGAIPRSTLLFINGLHKNKWLTLMRSCQLVSRTEIIYTWHFNLINCLTIIHTPLKNSRRDVILSSRSTLDLEHLSQDPIISTISPLRCLQRLSLTS